MGQTKDVLPAVPPVEAQQHIAADGEVQLIAGILPGQLFQREDAVILPALLRLLHLPAADLEAEAHLRASSAKQPHISTRSGPGADVPCLKGETPAGMTTTRSGQTRAAAARRLFRWP